MLSVVPLLVASSACLALWAGCRPARVRLPHDRVPDAQANVLASAPPSWFVAMAGDAALTPVERWWQVALAAPVAAAAAVCVMAGPAMAVCAGSLVVAGELAALRAMRGRATALLARSVPEVLDAVARSCRAGSSVVGALGDLGADDGLAGPVFADVARQVGHGVSLRDALDGVVTAHPEPSVRLAAAALLVGADTGAAPARAVDGVAATLRDRVALEREAAGHATQANASAAVLVVAPVGFGVVAVVTDPRVGGFLFSSPLGWACLVAGVGLDVVGAWWMARLVRSAR